MLDNRGKTAAKGSESGQRFKGRKNNGNLINPPKRKLVKTMVVEYIAKSTSSVVTNIKNKKKIKPTDDDDDDHHHHHHAAV